MLFLFYIFTTEFGECLLLSAENNHRIDILTTVRGRVGTSASREQLGWSGWAEGKESGMWTRGVFGVSLCLFSGCTFPLSELPRQGKGHGMNVQPLSTAIIHLAEKAVHGSSGGLRESRNLPQRIWGKTDLKGVCLTPSEPRKIVSCEVSIPVSRQWKPFPAPLNATISLWLSVYSR